MNGKSATEFKEMKDEIQKNVGQGSHTDENSNGGGKTTSDSDAIKEFFHNCTFKQHQILLKVRGDQQQLMTSGGILGGLGPSGEHRHKFFAAKVMPYSV